MIRRFDLPAQVPLFPLEGALLLPRARLPLQLFEPRYLQMLDDTLKTGPRLIGMIQPLADGGLAPIGCAGRVTAFTETEDGRYMISLRAISRFRLIEAEEGFAPYLKGRVDWTPYSRDIGTPESDPAFDREGFTVRLRRFMDDRDLSTDWSALADAEDELLVNSLSMLLPFEPGEKQALLEAMTLPERREILDGLIRFSLHQHPHAEERLQ